MVASKCVLNSMCVPWFVELIPFETVNDAFPHFPKIGDYLKLECTPPYSYPSGLTYWGESEPGSKFKPIETNDRIALDYDGT